jgi:feruloyl esterase
MPRYSFAFLCVAAAACAPAFAADCDAVTGLKLADTTITSAKGVGAGAFVAPDGAGRGGANPYAGLGAFCAVHGVIKPTATSAIQFEVWLPAAGWNGRLQVVGNGGLAGTISYPAMAAALKAGFATASTDTGHTTKEPIEWLRDKERLIDYSYRGLHLTTVNAKAITGAYYTEQPKKSYYTGCSTGGKQGLMEAQRFPADFDGIVAGNAANFWSRQMISEIWNGVATSSAATNLPQEKLQLVQDAVLAQCDALDGVKDGLIADHRRCSFDVKKLRCSGADGANCLTSEQVAAVEKVYTGPVNPRTGKPFYAGMFPGNELGWGKNGGQMVINRAATSGVSSNEFMRIALFGDPTREFRTFDFDKDAQAMEEKFAPITDATNPDLEEFRRLGHKLLYYHGAADPLIPAQNGINYYESVEASQAKRGNDAAKTQQFMRAFLVPGLYHCAGGPGANGFGTSSPASAQDADHDVVSAVVKWAEQGAAPEKIVATKYVEGAPAKGIAFQRPLCPWPLAARYKGTGESNDAGNWSCVK